jgi:hypothetical protein
MRRQSRDRRRARYSRGRGLRTLVQAMSFVGVFALILLAGADYLGIGGTALLRGKLLGAGDSGPPPPDGKAFRIGSIVVVPWSGKVCEERQFDNHTGRIVGDAMVNCEARLQANLQAQMAPPPQDSASGGQTAEKQDRMRSVLGGFKR